MTNPNRVAPVTDQELRALLEASKAEHWIGVIKPNGKGPGLIGEKALRGTGAQGCIAVVNSIPGGAQRVAITKLLALAPALAAEVLRLREEIAWSFRFPDYAWYEDLIEWLGDWHDEEACDGPQDLIAEVKARFDALPGWQRERVSDG